MSASPSSKRRHIEITPDVAEFLGQLLRPLELDHTAPHCDMIKNVVLEGLRRRVASAIENKFY